MRDSKGRVIVAHGQLGCVVFGASRTGASPAEEYLMELSDRDAERMMTLFERSCRVPPLSKDQFRAIKGSDLFEYKRGRHRILCYIDGPARVLLCGFAKSSQKTPRKEIQRAERLRREDQQRACS